MPFSVRDRVAREPLPRSYLTALRLLGTTTPHRALPHSFASSQHRPKSILRDGIALLGEIIEASRNAQAIRSHAL